MTVTGWSCQTKVEKVCDSVRASAFFCRLTNERERDWRIEKAAGWPQRVGVASGVSEGSSAPLGEASPDSWQGKEEGDRWKRRRSVGSAGDGGANDDDDDDSVIVCVSWWCSMMSCQSTMELKDLPSSPDSLGYHCECESECLVSCRCTNHHWHTRQERRRHRHSVCIVYRWASKRLLLLLLLLLFCLFAAAVAVLHLLLLVDTLSRSVSTTADWW